MITAAPLPTSPTGAGPVNAGPVDAAPVEPSPLLGRPGAVEATGPDAGTAWHYGDPLGEQRVLNQGAGLIDRSHRGVLVVPGTDRLGWLHSICSQHVSGLADGDTTHALVLSPNGHVEQDWRLVEIGGESGGQVWIDVEPGAAAPALEYLTKMRFMKRVEPADVSADFAVLSVVGPKAADVIRGAGWAQPAPGRAIATAGGGFVRANSWTVGNADGHAGAPLADTPVESGSHGDTRLDASGDDFDLVVPRADLARVAGDLIAAGAQPVGAWAAAAHRVERRRPRLGFDNDHRTIPHEIGLIGVAVHLNKGCYRGQETVARVQNLGRPPRRLVLLHLSGERDELPEPGTPIERDGRPVGFLGTAVHHYELGPIALAVVKRNLPDDAQLVVAGNTAAIDPT